MSRGEAKKKRERKKMRKELPLEERRGFFEG